MRLIPLTLAWLGGILLAHLLWTQGIAGCHAPWWAAGALAGLVVLFAGVLRWRSSRALAGAGLLVMLLLGAWRYSVQPLAACVGAGDLAYYNAGATGEPVWATVEGVVLGYPDVRDTQVFYRLQADEISIDGQRHSVRGALLLQAPREPAWHYGDRLRVTGLLEAPPIFSDFDYRAYLARQGIYSVQRRSQVTLAAHGQGSPFWASIYALRDAGRAVLDRSLPEPEAALANGMLLGIQKGIPSELNQAFKDTGTAHVVVISGSNIALLAGLLMAGLGSWLGKRRAAPVVIGAIALYVLLVGADAAPLRAGIMGALAVAAIMFGRQNTPLILLTASTWLITALDPRSLWDIGFQLSVLATLGLVLYFPGLQARTSSFLNARLPAGVVPHAASFLSDTLVVTVAAQITTLPLMVYYFGRTSLISLLANLLILPAQPPLLASGLITLVAGLIWQPLGQTLATVPWLFLSYTVAVVRLLAQVPLAVVDLGAWGRTLALIYYGVLGLALARRWTNQAGRSVVLAPLFAGLTRRRLAWAACLAGPLVVVALVLGGRPDGRLHLYFLPTANGEACLILTPAGRSTLVWDGRGDRTAIMLAAADRLGRSPDLWLVPAAAMGGLSVTQVNPTALTGGQVLRLDNRVTLTRLAAGGEWAFLLEYGELRALVPATLSQEAQAALAGELTGPLTLLKAPGPGAGAWPALSLLQAARPALVIWPQDTTYPPSVASNLLLLGARRVPADVALEVVSDGQKLWLLQWSGETRR